MNRSHAASQVATAWGYFLPQSELRNQLTTETDYNPGGNDADAITGTKVTQRAVFATPRTVPYSPLTPTTDIVTTTVFEPGRGLPTKVSDPNGGETHVGYNPLGQTLTVHLPDRPTGSDPSLRYTYTYDPEADAPGRVHTETLRDYAGSTAVYDDSYAFYDGWGRPIETQVPQPETPGQQIVTATGYDERGLVRYSIPATAPATSIGFSTVFQGHPTTLPRYTQTSYDGAGRPLVVQDKSFTAVVATTTAAYRGDLTVLQPPVGGVTVTELDFRDQPVRVRLHATSDPATAAIDAVNYAYTPRGEMKSATKTLDGVSYVWSYGYDMTSRQLWAHDPDTGATTSSYDDAGNPRTVTTGPIAPKDESLNLTDPYHPVVNQPSSIITTSYDRLNRPILTQDYTDYDATDPQDKPVDITTWTYDEAGVDNSIGQLTTTTHPITGIESGLLEGKYPHDYQAKTLAYDSRGLPTQTSESYPGWMTDEDPDALITREWQTSYNEAGQPTETIHPAVPGLPAATIDYSYTTGGRLRTMSLDETGTPLRIAHLTYNNIGRTASLGSGTYTNTTGNTLANGVLRNYAFEPATGRFDILQANITPTLTGGGSGPTVTAFTLDYSYDAGGNPTSIKGTAKNPGALTTDVGYWCYGYDGLNRLTRARTGTTDTCTNTTAATTVTGANYDLTYQHAADRLSAVVDNLHSGGTNPQPLRVDYLTETANEDDNRQRPHHNTKLTHQPLLGGLLDWPEEMPAPGTIVNDDQGRIKRWSTALDVDLIGDPVIGDTGPGASSYEYTYNNLGQLEHSQAALPPNVPVEALSSSAWYAYRPDGTRFARRTQNLALGVQQKTTVFLADGTEITTPTTLNNTETVRTFTTPAGTPVATQTSNNTSDDPAGTNHQATWTWLAADAQNSVRLVYKHNTTGTNTTGGTAADDIERPTYYPYGDSTEPGVPKTPNASGYLNKHHDLTGDIRLDHRNYTANLNTLTTPDPILRPDDPQTFNPYAYARNNPTAFSDPTGLEVWAHKDPDGDTHIAGNVPTSAPYGPSAVYIAEPQEAPSGEQDMANHYVNGSPLPTNPPVEYDACYSDCGETFGGPLAMLDFGAELTGVKSCTYGFSAGWCAMAILPPGRLLRLGRTGRLTDDAADAGSHGGNAAKTRRLDNVDGLPCNCFVAGTKVQTADGAKPIEDVEVGDQVWAKDLTSGSSELRTVTALFQKQADSVMTIRGSSGTEVTVTDEHPFYVAGEGWVMSGDLRVGDELDQRDGGTTVIRAIDVAPTNATVYNFTVEGDHNYYVTDAQLLVHNCSYVNLTTKGSRTRNVGTDLTHTEFAENMTAAGWSSTTHPSGHQIFMRGGAKYVLRDKARDYAGWTADFTPAGATRSTLKLRLGYPP